MLVSDTNTLPLRDRRDALEAAFSTTEVPVLVGVANHAGALRHRIDTWSLGPGMHIIRTEGTGFSVRRGPTQLRISAPERVGFSVQVGAPARWDSIAGVRAVRAGEVQLVDQTSASHFRSDLPGSVISLVFDYNQLGVSVDTVRAAIPKLPASALYDIFRTDLAYACAVLDESDLRTTASHVGSGLRALAKAMIATEPFSPAVSEVG